MCFLKFDLTYCIWVGSLMLSISEKYNISTGWPKKEGNGKLAPGVVHDLNTV